jgi:hypothetical protein
MVKLFAQVSWVIATWHNCKKKLHVYFLFTKGSFQQYSSTGLLLDKYCFFLRSFKEIATLVYRLPFLSFFQFLAIPFFLSMFSSILVLLSFNFLFLSSTFCAPKRCFHIAVEPILVGHPFPTENA